MSLKVVIGAGGIYEKGWIPTSYDTINVSDKLTWSRYFKENSISIILAEHVWEHLTPKDSIEAAKNIFQFLKPGGHFRVAVPDGYHPEEIYINAVAPTTDTNELKQLDTHKVLYNYKTLMKVFEDVGLTIELLEYYDENKVFHYNQWDPKEGLIYRSDRFKFLRSEVSILNLPNFTSLILDAKKPFS